MIGFEHVSKIVQRTDSKIVLFVMDGLGGLPHPDTGRTELEMARTPNLDEVAAESICGLIDPVSPGITPGSGPGHLALFGYDPLKYEIGRGVMEALGIGVELKEEDVAARGNFCTVDTEGRISDRRAGRISTEKNQELCRLLSGIKVAGVELVVAPVKEHRFVLLLRGKKLSGELNDSDPQHVGLSPLPVKAVSSSAETTARLVNEFVVQAKETLRSCHPANMVLLRGFSQLPRWPLMRDVFKLNPAAIASYPMYRGLARLVGMKILVTGGTLAEELATLRQHYNEHDFFFLHVKQTDSRGEDGDFQAKVKAIEEIDAYLPELLSLKPDVLMVTGDHSTPATLAAHSWHPVPFMLRSRWCRPDHVKEFNELACALGAMGRFPAVEIMTLALANALKLDKFGA